jgi:hypothetical protein
MYLDLLEDQTKYLRKYIWKIKVSLKIKIFMWFLHLREVLTKDNLAKRNWKEVRHVFSVIKMNPYNTCSLNVHLQKLYGE